MTKPKSNLLDFRRATLNEALEGKGSTVLIALSEISSVTEFCPRSEMLPEGMSIIRLKQKDVSYPVIGDPDALMLRIRAASQELPQ